MGQAPGPFTFSPSPSPPPSPSPLPSVPLPLPSLFFPLSHPVLTYFLSSSDYNFPLRTQAKIINTITHCLPLLGSLLIIPQWSPSRPNYCRVRRHNLSLPTQELTSFVFFQMEICGSVQQCMHGLSMDIAKVVVCKERCGKAYCEHGVLLSDL